MKSMNCREITKCDVLDSLGDKIGRIGDMTFTFDGDLKLSQFILEGSRVEELLESLKVKPDMDPIFDASIIRRIGDHIRLNTQMNSLKTTLEEGAIPKGEIRLSELQKLEIVDKEDVKVGKAVDVDFDVDGTASLIVGGGIVEETLESLGLKSDIDIIVPTETIESMGEKIKLKVSKDELKLTMDDALKTDVVDRIKDHRERDKRVIRVQLHHLKI
jgi:sporulation protein YlmC with PRC-barrel domain